MNNIYYLSKPQMGKSKCWIEENGYYGFHFASFNTLEQLKRFVAKFGGKLKVKDKINFDNGEKFYSLTCGLNFVTSGCFYDRSEVPFNSKPIKALSNGSIVDCYYTVNGDTVAFYRPNPNAKNVYEPMAILDHIKYQKENGIF